MELLLRLRSCMDWSPALLRSRSSKSLESMLRRLRSSESALLRSRSSKSLEPMLRRLRSSMELVPASTASCKAQRILPPLQPRDLPWARAVSMTQQSVMMTPSVTASFICNNTHHHTHFCLCSLNVITCVSGLWTTGPRTQIAPKIVKTAPHFRTMWMT